MKTLLILTTLLHFTFAFASEKTSTKVFPEVRKASSIDSKKIHMGINVGANTPAGDYETSSLVSIEAGYQPVIPFGIVGEFFTTPMRRDDVEDENQRTGLLMRGNYNFGGSIPVIKHSHVGLAAGPMITSEELEFGLGPVTGFDIPLNIKGENNLSLGANIKYLLVTGDSEESLMTNLALKYWY